jgi:2-dehydropantoate 2-reductase
VLKVCVVGAGAIGGFLGTRLALTGEADVAALARGTTLVALRDHGWRLESDGQQLSAPAAKAADDPRELGPQDLVIITVKAPALPRLAPTLRPLIGPETIILPAMNGVPWWFSIGLGALGGEPLASVDPDGQIAATLPLAQVLGCVVHASASQREPGVALHRMGRGLIIGEPGGGESARVRALAGLFGRADFDVSCSSNIRYDVWYKLWGNMTMNPVSALTGATVDKVLDDSLVNAFCLEVMREAAAIGARIGCPIEQSGRDRNAITRKLGAFKTSMLQDVEAGKPVEIDVLLSAVREIGEKVGEPTPQLDTLLGLSRLHARTRGLYPM